MIYQVSFPELPAMESGDTLTLEYTETWKPVESEICEWYELEKVIINKAKLNNKIIQIKKSCKIEKINH